MYEDSPMINPKFIGEGVYRVQPCFLSHFYSSVYLNLVKLSTNISVSRQISNRQGIWGSPKPFLDLLPSFER